MLVKVNRLIQILYTQGQNVIRCSIAVSFCPAPITHIKTNPDKSFKVFMINVMADLHETGVYSVFKLLLIKSISGAKTHIAQYPLLVLENAIFCPLGDQLASISYPGLDPSPA